MLDNFYLSLFGCLLLLRKKLYVFRVTRYNINNIERKQSKSMTLNKRVKIFVSEGFNELNRDRVWGCSAQLSS